jgi:hypothetical protein
MGVISWICYIRLWIILHMLKENSLSFEDSSHDFDNENA